MSNYSESYFSEDPNSSWFKAFTYIKPKAKVLDIGCSSGNFGQVLKEQKDCIVDGVEPDPDDFRAAQKHLRNVYMLNVETDDLSVLTEKYDYIYFGDVIEHLVTPIPTLRRVASLLKTGGSIVFSIPNMSHLSVRLMLLKGEFLRGETGLLDKTHLHFYTHSEIQRVFSEAGYYIDDLSPVLKDLPKAVVGRELASVGLAVSDKFLEFAGATEASVYQFVGVAKMTTKKPKTQKLHFSSPVDLFQVYLDETKQYYEARIKANEQHIAKLENVVREQGQELSDLQGSRIVRTAIRIKEARRRK